MIKIAIVGYGNLGKACERIAARDKEIEISGIFTRRDPKILTSPFNSEFYPQDSINSFEGNIDVVCICTGSANDVTELGAQLAEKFNTVDSFDTHAKMREYYEAMRAATACSGRLSFIGIGWDPGLFSLIRALSFGVLPDGDTKTFWGRGVSQGHSEAIRRIEGVEDAIQYTVPKAEAIALARSGGGANLLERDMHLRECYVAVADGADKEVIKQKIATMPNYFAPYDTAVNFIGKEELRRDYAGMPHAGLVTRTGQVNGMRQKMEFSLDLSSNPDFTASVLISYAKANARLAAAGERGVRTALDIPVSALFDGKEDIIKRFV